jgi:hypothetical protein
MVKALPGGGYVLPAGMHPLVLVILRGEIRVCRPGGMQPMARISLCGGTRESLRAWAAPGTRILTLAVKPGSCGGSWIFRRSPSWTAGPTLMIF